jgi:outer membrane usher protein
MMSLAGTSWRRAAVAAAMLALAASAGLPVAAQPRAEAAPPINPTGRTLEMAVPLHTGKFYLGDLEARITPDQKVLVPVKALMAAVAPVLRQDALAALEAAGAGQDHVDLGALGRAGFDFRFDPETVGMRFAPKLDQKAKGNVKLRTRADGPDSPNAAQPAQVSAYLNMRATADYITRTPSGREGARAPRVDLDGAARWRGVVVEAEATYEPDDTSLFGERGEGFKRRGTRIVRDFEEDAVRLSAGDVSPTGTSFQYTPDLLGLSVARSYSTLQPGRNIRATSRRSFRIERPSRVDVQVNGITIRRLTLDSGDYDLDDLPVGLGSSDVVLEIEDDSGHRERLEFSVFRANDLIEPGLSEWAFAAGMPTGFRDGEPDYESDDYFLSGFYRRGLRENVTSEAHLQLNSDTVMGGVGTLLGSPIGLFTLEAATSYDAGQWGAAFDGSFTLADFDGRAGRRDAVRMSAKLRSPDFTGALPEARETGDRRGGRRSGEGDWLALSANYGTALPFDVAAHLTAGYSFSEEPYGDGYRADLSLSRAISAELSLGLGGGYFARQNGEEELSLLMRLEYQPDRQSSLAAAFDPGAGGASLSYSRRSETHGVGSWQAEFDLSREEADTEDGGDNLALNGEAHYVANRANLTLSQQSRFAGVEARDLDQRTSLRVETAIAYADGHAAIGRPVGAGFAIVAPSAGLANNEVTVGKSASGISAKTDALGPALVSDISSYTPNRIDFDVDDLPAGYDLGDGLFELMPKHRSGFALTVGSNYTISALGTLLAADGRPVALLTGTATEEATPDRKVQLFTNREGRFSAQGLAPGRWLLEVATTPPTRYALVIPDGAVGLHRAGDLRPLP